MSTEAPNNVTTPATAYALPYHTWMTYEVFSVLLSVIATYILASLLAYSVQQNIDFFKRRHLSTRSTKTERDVSGGHSSAGVERGQSVSSNRERGKRRRMDGTGKSARPLRVLCIFAAFFAVVRMAADQLELGTYYSGVRVNCKVYQVVVVITYSLCATCIYSALWFRLRIFLNHPVMNHLTTKKIGVVMWISLATIICSSLLNTLIFSLATTAVDSPEGCKLGVTAPIPSGIRYVILAFTSVGSQLLLLALFLYPLLKHRSTMVKSEPKAVRYTVNPPTSPPLSPRSPTERGQVKFPKSLRITMQKGHANGQTGPASSARRYDSDSDMDSVKNVQTDAANRYRSFRQKKQINRQRHLVNIMWRVLATAIVCVISDVVTAVVSIAFSGHPRIVPNLIYNLNLLVNLCSVLFSFGDWKDRLFPLCANCWKEQEKRQRTSSTSAYSGPRSPAAFPNNKNIAPYMDSSSAACNSRGLPISEDGEEKSDSVFDHA
nr:uncharacterized protein LOC100182467 [Ciona intestinalis]|eukprot:XP_002120922.1 uncharacterized protein LOC100182467 [Ciona intestinalis]